MTFAEELMGHTRRYQREARLIVRNSANHAYRSIVEGSEVTGAPGQPVDTGALKASWRITYQRDGVAGISSDSPYAHVIEDNERGAMLRSQVGGFHSVKITRAGWGRIVEHETRAVKSGGGAAGGIPRNVLGQFERIGRGEPTIRTGPRG